MRASSLPLKLSLRPTALPLPALPSRRIALHAARIGGGLAAAARAGGGGEAAFRPGRADLDHVSALLELFSRLRRDAAFHDQHAGPCGAWPERDREVLGVPGWRVDRLLEIEPSVDMAQEELRRPLVLLVAAG